MLIPTKHTNFSESLLGFGSYILKKIEYFKSVDELWSEYLLDYKNRIYPAKHSFDNLLLTLTFLYSIGILEEQDGGVIRCN
ncbi:MAG: ABC-three component system middle component 6 [Tepidanaerobacteraceae bacterium]|nr:hypothetical protein [Thermoanaerobacterales bacterium]